MSVINEMLQDLEQRKLGVQGEQVSVVAQEKTGFKKALIFVAALLVLASIFWELGALSSLVQGQVGDRPAVVARAPVADESEPETNGSLRGSSVENIIEPVIEPSVTVEPEALIEPSIVQAVEVPEPEAEPVVMIPEVVKPEVVKPEPEYREEHREDSQATHMSSEAEPEPEKIEAVDVVDIVDTVDAKAETLKPGEMQIVPVQLTPAERARVYRSQAQSAITGHNPTKAREAFEKVLSLEPEASGDRIQLATLYFAQGEESRGIDLLKSGVNLTPDNPSLRLALARISMKQGDIEQAWRYLDALSPDVAEYSEYIATYAGLAQRRGENQVAEQSYGDLAYYQPSDGRWWIGLAIAQDRLGDYEQAVGSYQMALSCDLSTALRQFALKRVKELEQ